MLLLVLHRRAVPWAHERLQLRDLLARGGELAFQVLDLPVGPKTVSSISPRAKEKVARVWVFLPSYLIEDMRLFVSLVNWHFTLRLEHSEQLDMSVASHCGRADSAVEPPSD